MKTFVFTSGDINGIGPEIVFKTLNRIWNTQNRFIFIIPQNAFEITASFIVPEFDYEISNGKSFKWKSPVQIIKLKNTAINQGEPTKSSGKASFNAIEMSFGLLRKKLADAVITGPISKYALSLAHISYPGHTEMFAEWCNVKEYLMMFLSDNFNAALNTIHIPLKYVVKTLGRKKLANHLNIAVNTLRKDLGIRYPKVAVLGLNPHAGEEGIIGKEEKRIISPVISKIKECAGPFSPDAFFAAKNFKNYDLIFGMYHDQVLIPFKMMNFNSGVNYTAGLPIIRTSPDHGTAFDIAGKGIADEASMLEAYRYAGLIAKNRIISG